MIKWNDNLTAFIWRFGFFACCNLLDALILFQGNGIRLQTTLIAIYRWILYTPLPCDLQMFIVFGFFWDVIYHLPFGFHSFLILLTFVTLNTQKRYLQVNNQYIRWLVFLGVIILVNQFEYVLHFLINQQIVLSLKLVFSFALTFSLYPFIFKFLQHYDR